MRVVTLNGSYRDSYIILCCLKTGRALQGYSLYPGQNSRSAPLIFLYPCFLLRSFTSVTLPPGYQPHIPDECIPQSWKIT
ncbi:hypothetical protein PUATCC27989T_01706 [Phytobacter ursingii]|nr:hypothetical protein PUATCC27989T_01706 [Phytobacter ursingii]